VRVRAVFFAILLGAASQSGCVTLGNLAPTAPGLSDLLSVATTLGSAVTPIGEQEEIEIGRSIAANVAGKYGIVRDEQLTRYICLVGETVAAKSDRPDLIYHFAVLDTDIINAFSCPGGYVFVTRGTLAVIDSEAELAAVLAHEICHVAHKDIISEIEKQQFFQAGNKVAGTLLHTDPAIFNAATSFGTGLLFKGFSRSDEYAADKQALSYTARAGYDPAGLLTFLEKLKGASGASDGGVKLLLATHPQIDGRIAKVEAELAGMPEQGRTGERLDQRYIEQIGFRPGLR
jgi:beta-barrel assembly-enhancing protease